MSVSSVNARSLARLRHSGKGAVCHCEERSDEAISGQCGWDAGITTDRDCFVAALLAMTVLLVLGRKA
jgi:hypothetical protein